LTSVSVARHRRGTLRVSGRPLPAVAPGALRN
jgi:hypothetical protein